MLLNNAQEQKPEGELLCGCSVCWSRVLTVAAGQEDEVRWHQVPRQRAAGRGQAAEGILRQPHALGSILSSTAAPAGAIVSHPQTGESPL